MLYGNTTLFGEVNDHLLKMIRHHLKLSDIALQHTYSGLSTSTTGSADNMYDSHCDITVKGMEHV